MFIVDLLTISPQNTYSANEYLQKHITFQGNKLVAAEPNYQGVITSSQLRRMGKSLRMGIGCGLPLLQKHENIEGIIIGTSEGGLEGCISFLNQIVDYDEGTLTPTNFIQSTPNAVAGQLALITGNTNYNITHVNGGLSFENSLLDAEMLLEEKSSAKVLVGNVEEISEYNFNIDTTAGNYKKETIDSNDLIGSNTSGTVAGEGAAMFILSGSPKPNGAIEILSIETISEPTTLELENLCHAVLSKHNLTFDQIDGVIVGMNGDNRSDHWYDGLVKKHFQEQTIFTYKNLVGEYPTSSAFAVKMGVDLLSGMKYSDEIVWQKGKSNFKNLLIYNHYKGKQHSFILLSKSSSI